MCDITQQMNDDWEKRNKDLLLIKNTYMTFEQKSLLRNIMRNVGLAKGYMLRHGFYEVDQLLERIDIELQKLANEVKMNGE